MRVQIPTGSPKASQQPHGVSLTETKRPLVVQNCFKWPFLLHKYLFISSLTGHFVFTLKYINKVFGRSVVLSPCYSSRYKAKTGIY